MGSTALALFVLACGWLFFSRFELTRFVAIYKDGHPQYFGSALAAGYLAMLSGCLHFFCKSNDFYVWICETMSLVLPLAGKDDVPSTIKALGPIALWSAALAWTLPDIFNAPLERNNFLRFLVRLGVEKEDDLDNLIDRAIQRGLSVAVTLDSRKVYVGTPISETTQERKTWFVLIPLASGFRDETGELELPTTYGATYDYLTTEGQSSDRSIDDFRVLLPVDKIVSAQLFDLELYAKHFVAQPQNGEGSEGEDTSGAAPAEPEEITSDAALQVEADDSDTAPRRNRDRLSDDERRGFYLLYLASCTLTIVLLPMAWWGSLIFLALAVLANAFLRDDAASAGT